MGKVFGYAKELVIHSLAKTVLVSFGEWENKISVQAIIVRDEMVYKAPVNGRLKAFVQEDLRVPEGFLLAEVRGEGANEWEKQPVYPLTAQKAGVVCFHLDGLEQVVTPKSIINLDDRILRQKLEEGPLGDVNYREGSLAPVDSGTALFKVVNNLKPIIIDLRVPREVFSKPVEADEQLYLRLPQEKGRWPAVVTHVVEDQEELRIIAESTQYSPALLHQRMVELELIAGVYRGYLVPQSALVNMGEETGVYVSFLGKFHFKPVELEGQVGEMVVISGLDPNDEVLVNPQIMVKE